MVDVTKAKCLDYPKFVLSALLLIFSTVCTTYAIIEKKTSFWDVMPGWAALIVFLLCIFWLGVMEGLQVALVELKRVDARTYRESHPHAYKLGQMANRKDNVERFLMGRQMFVVFIVFFAAKLTTIHSKTDDDFLFPIPDWFRSVFLETGILACVLLVIVAQLMPQIIAAKHPVAFLEFWIMRPGYYACIFLESTGITHITWVISYCLARICGMHHREPEEHNDYSRLTFLHEYYVHNAHIQPLPCVLQREVLQRELSVGSTRKLLRQETQDSAFSEETPRTKVRGNLSRQETGESSEMPESPIQKPKHCRLQLPE